MRMKGTTLTPDKQKLFCSYTEHVTAKGAGTSDHYLGYVYDFLVDVDEVNKRGYIKYRKSHSAEFHLSGKQQGAISDFMSWCGIQIGGIKKRARTKALEKRSRLDEKAQQILNGFSEWLVKENAYSQNTVKGYIFGAKDFLCYSTSISTEVVKGYKAAMEEQGKLPRTVNQRLNSVAALAKYLGKHIEIKHTKIPRTLSLENVPTEKEIEKLLAYCKAHNEKAYIWIRLLSTTGARVHEFVMFTYEMVAAGHVDLKGKGSKVRRFFFTPKVQQECAEYAEKNKLQGTIAVNRAGGVCSTRGVAKLLHAMAERAGVDAKKCHPHAFRHFFAKMYLKRSKTKDVTELADLLGHSGLDTTMVYIKRSQEEQKRMFNKNVDW